MNESKWRRSREVWKRLADWFAALHKSATDYLVLNLFRFPQRVSKLRSKQALGDTTLNNKR